MEPVGMVSSERAKPVFEGCTSRAERAPFSQAPQIGADQSSRLGAWPAQETRTLNRAEKIEQVAVPFQELRKLQELGKQG
jgi:hypothetical protein